MAELINAKCPNCGAILELPAKLDRAFCMHCGGKVIIARDEIRIYQGTGSVESYLELGRKALDIEEYEEAMRYLEKALEIDPKNEDVNRLLSQIYLEEGNRLKKQAESLMKLGELKYKQATPGIFTVNNPLFQVQSQAHKIEGQKYFEEAGEIEEKASIYLKKAGVCPRCAGEGKWVCFACKGTGKCSFCFGRGKIGLFAKCILCKGSGICRVCKGTDVCLVCNGTGKFTKKRDIMCPTCGYEPKLIDQYNKYFCYVCGRYVNPVKKIS